MTAELLVRRVLGGVSFIDAITGLPVSRALEVTAPGVRWIRNRSGDYVVALAPGLAAHATEFAQPPGAPPLGSAAITVTVRDPLGVYLPRRAAVPLPRDPDPTHANQAGSLFRPLQVALYPAPIAPSAPGWCVLRVTVLGAAPGTRLPGALLRVVQDGTARILGRGMADDRGEALVAVAGIPITTFGHGGGPVLATQVAAHVQVFPPAAGPPPVVGDPDQLETQPVLKSAPVQLASGRSLSMSL